MLLRRVSNGQPSHPVEGSGQVRQLPGGGVATARGGGGVGGGEARKEGSRKQAECSESEAKGHNIPYDTLSLRHVVLLTSL